MHIPDGYLSPLTCATTYAISLSVLAFSVKKVSKEFDERKIPFVALGSAFSFVIMMFNIPIPGGTTGHCIGGTLLAIILGPYLSSISIFLSLLIQALLFGDGGITTLGANSLTMAIVMPFVGYSFYNLFTKNESSKKSKLVASFLASYLSTCFSSFFISIILGIQPFIAKDGSGLPLYFPFPLKITVPAIVLPHLLLFGVVEGAITLLVLNYILKLDESVIFENKKPISKKFSFVIVLLALLSPMGIILPSIFNSKGAWGEWNGEEMNQIAGFIPKGFEKFATIWKPLFPDYSIPLLNSSNFVFELIFYIASGFIGIVIFFALFRAIKFFLKKVETQ